MTCEVELHRGGKPFTCQDCFLGCYTPTELMLHRVNDCPSLTTAEQYTEAFLWLHHPTAPAQGLVRKELKAALVRMASV